MSDEPSNPLIEEINAILRPTRITASLEGEVVNFGTARVKVIETLESVIRAAEFAKAAEIEPPTAAFAKGYYEQFLTWPSMAARLPFRSGSPQEVLTSQDGTLRCTFSRPSLQFTLAVLLQNPTLPLRALMGVTGAGMRREVVS